MTKTGSVGSPFGGATMKSPQSLDKAGRKKLQSSIKADVQSFGKLLLSYSNHVQEIDRLIDSLEALLMTRKSVGVTSSTIDFWRTLAMTPNGFEHSLDAYFAEIGPMIIGQIDGDIESICVQLKQFM